MVRVTITFDWNNTIRTHTIELMKIVRQSGGHSLSEAKHAVEACVEGEPIVLNVATAEDAQTLARQVANAGFVAEISNDSYR